MATKTLTFKFIKKSILKFSKDGSTVSLKTGKKLLSLQTIDFSAGGVSYYCAPVKILKDELVYSLKSGNLEIEGLLKFKVIVKNDALSEFESAIKDKTVLFRSIGFNINPIAGVEILNFSPTNLNNTKNLLEIN